MKLIIAVSLVFSSCMHAGMMGTGEGHHSGASLERAGDHVLEKEVIVGDVRALALFPPLRRGEDVMLTLRLVDANTGTAISGAQVFFHAQYTHTIDRNETHDHSGAKSTGRPESAHDIHIEQEVEESRETGVYSLPYGSSQPGNHTLMFHITAIGERRLDPEITVEATRRVPAEGHDHQRGMMGDTSMSTYVIVGAAAMAVMMIVMLAGRGGMF